MNINEILENAKFSRIESSVSTYSVFSAYSVFYDTLSEVSNRLFSKSKQTPKIHPEPRRPWWDSKCNAVVHQARRALREWQSAPLSVQKREAWHKAEAVKRRYINSAKRGRGDRIYPIWTQLAIHQRYGVLLKECWANIQTATH